MSNNTNKLETEVVFDREQCFLMFSIFCGDCEKTAHALGIRAVDVLKASEELGWQSKLAPILALKKSSRPGDYERAMNRALAFSQAHRFRMFVDKVITKVTGMTEDQFQEYIFTAAGKEGSRVAALSMKPLADLATALEKCNAVASAALGDTVRERTARNEAGGDGAAAGDIHGQIAKAMAAVRADSSPRAMLLDAQLEAAQAVKDGATRPVDPYNKG